MAMSGTSVGTIRVPGTAAEKSGSIVDIQPHLAVSPRSLVISYILAVPLGILGAHHFYLGRHKFGVLYIFTGGLFLLGWVLDLIRMPCLVSQANKLRQGAPEKYRNAQDAYVLWIPPFGLLGFHQYYLGRYGWGVLYTLTLGLCGSGWLVDGLRMPFLVRAVEEQHWNKNDDDMDKKLSDVYVLLLPPFGLLGAHQYYLGRWGFGVIYTCTFGLLGMGWLVDIVTLNMQLQRSQQVAKRQVDPHMLYLDEAFKLHFPLGFLGLHHFYLRRPAWGLLYFFTMGLFFIGWILDTCRLKTLVREANEQFEQLKANLNELQKRKSGLGGAIAYPAAPPIMDSNGIMRCPSYPGTTIVTFTQIDSSVNLPVQLSVTVNLPSTYPSAPPYPSRPPPAYQPPPPSMHQAMPIIEEDEEADTATSQS